MNKKLNCLLLGCSMVFSMQVKSQNYIPVFDKVLFYDGYKSLEALAGKMDTLPDGFYRLKTSVITTKLSDTQLNLLCGSIRMDVVVKAACDNYDRLGHVTLAFVPKDSVLYTQDKVQRIEIARFVTPFMDKNRKPDTVPYTFQVDYLQHLFQDKNLREQYNFWLELDIFGVPYAANTQIAGCAGRNDVFYGSLSFTTTASAACELENDNVFIPMFVKTAFNNYRKNTYYFVDTCYTINVIDTCYTVDTCYNKLDSVYKAAEYKVDSIYIPTASDTLGKTIRNMLFTFPENLTDAQLVLITSNHGANDGGEEYNRRWHYVYLNKEEVLRYLPGRTSCEPFRKYNTQGNNIYSSNPRTDAQWQSFSNWCPGDVIDTRIINLGALPAGQYLFTIEVPDAVFVGGQGNFPLSLYFQGKTSGTIQGKIPPKYTIKGNVTNNGNPLAGVVMGGGFSCTDSLGEYTAIGDSNATVIITPKLSGYTFNPPSITCSKLATNLSDKNFEATSIVGISDRNNSNSSTCIYPNPTTGKLIIDNGQLTIKNIDLYNIVGQKQLSIVNSQLSIEIDISHLAAGLYFLKIDGKTIKVIKE